MSLLYRLLASIFLLGVLCWNTPLATICTAEAAPDRLPPNIVVILADDLGYGDVGCYNPESKIPTPHIDRLAREGMRFTDAHTPTAVCTPTRYGLLTGRYWWRTQYSGVGSAIEKNRLTLPALLQQHGYATACIGKWHLGWTWPTKDGKRPQGQPSEYADADFTRPLKEGPATRGFDSYFGTDVPNFPPYCYINDDRTVGLPSVPSTAEFNRPGPMLPGWNWENILPELTRRAVGYVENAAGARRGRPFFLYFPLTGPHFPIVPTPEFRGRSGAGAYGDYVVQVDAAVGDVLDALERNALAEKTLVIFTSDNGPEVHPEVTIGAYARLQKYGHSSMGPLRGCKRDVWEGGHRVPCIARWPAKVPAGTVSGELVSLTDIMATVAAIIGSPLPDNSAEDSYNILPALLGGEGPRDAVVYHSGNTKFALRHGDWVWIDSPTGQVNSDANGEPAWFRQQRGYEPHDQPGELYNLAVDLSQQHNLYAERPDVVDRLKALLETYKRQGHSGPQC